MRTLSGQKPSPCKLTRTDPRRRHGNPDTASDYAMPHVLCLSTVKCCWVPTFQAEIRGKDKALLKEIAALEEEEADQVRREGQSRQKCSV